MWLLVLLLAFMASSSACPDPCDCHPMDRGDLAVLIEVSCRGRVPLPANLPPDTHRLKVDSADESEVKDFLGYLGNVSAGLPYLNELDITNCSVEALNVSWTGFERVHVLNLSRNNFVDLNDVQIVNMVNLSSLTVFDVSNNFINNISAETFRTLPILVWLCFKRNNISSVDEHAFYGLNMLEKLDLSDNKLASLPDSALTPLKSLQKLDLSGNQLQILGAGWFESLGRLRELDVSRNGLARAASGALQTLPGLSVLRLAGNPLQERDVSLLLGTGRKLETVDASRTGLARVPAALTRSVRALRLAGNKLTSIRGGDLDSYPLLRLLDISDNHLTVVEEDALGRLEVLEELNISRNILTDVPRSLPGSLTLLNLAGNMIAALKFNDLQGLNNLRSLFLNDNAIGEIQEGSLSQLPALIELDVSSNPIKQLPANTFNGPSSLATLRMSGLTSLEWDQQEQGDMSFPVPAPERLVTLDVSRSPVLAGQLLADTAALSACKSLIELNLEDTNITTLRSDLIYFLPQLHTLGLSDNRWKCTEDLYWLGQWTRQHNELQPPAQCADPTDITGSYLYEMPAPPTPLPTTSTSRTVTLTTDELLTARAKITSELTVEIMGYSIAPNITASSYIANTSNQEVIVNSSSVSINTKTIKYSSPRASGEKENTSMDASASSTVRGLVDTQLLTVPTLIHPSNISKIFRTFSQAEQNTVQSAARKEKNSSNNERKNKIDYSITDASQRSVPVINSQILPINESHRFTTNRNGQTSVHNTVTDKVQEKKIQKSVRFINRSLSMNVTKHITNNSNKTFSKGIPAKAHLHPEETAKSRKSVDAPGNLTGNSVSPEASMNTVAEELNGQATDSGARVSEPLSAGAHPGMLVLAGAALGAAAALTIVLSRRATARRRDRYQRHENIEVHTLSPVTELW